MTSQEQILKLHEVADHFVSLSGGRLSKKVNKGYVVLELRGAETSLNKNAISFIREGVTFMIPNSGFIEDANRQGLRAEKSKKYDRLLLKGLSMNEVTSRAEFFSRLVEAAVAKSERFQPVR